MDSQVDIITPDVIEAADYVSTPWRKGIESIFETGRRLIEKREQFKDAPGKWSRLIGANEWKGQGLLPFHFTWAYRLIGIAEDGRLLESTLIDRLPVNVDALYRLTKLPTPVLFAESTVRPDLQSSDVQLLINRISRAKRFEKLAAPELPTERVPVLYADPPWQFEVWEESSAYGAALEHYPTMPLADICALPIGEACATDAAILFLWTTAPMLREAFQVLDAWGFGYKTNMVWDKERQGMGYYVRNQHEELLIATRGDMPAPDPANKPVSVIREKRGKHSAKPHIVYDHIERMYPGLPKREFFGRYWRPGWCRPWGNMEIAEAGGYAEAAQ